MVQQLKEAQIGIPPNERFAIETQEASKALGLSLDPLKQKEYMGRALRLFYLLRDARNIDQRRKLLNQEGVASLVDLGLDFSKTNSGLVVWNPDGANFHGFSNDTHSFPHIVSLVRIDPLECLGATIPVKEFQIAEVKVGTVEFNYDFRSRGFREWGIADKARIALASTFK
ncbi:hypothetical protein C4559_03635 [Candidatus Microgenomates bacterium]|nr:MAG: hypothetical protein C4559_03635 [Candidatus Microgenomates bacterium]